MNRNVNRIVARGCARGALLCLGLASLLGSPALAEDWLQFRGPGSSGIGQGEGIPATWDASTNVVWKTKLPGPGGSCPIVVGNRVFLTSYSGYAESLENPGDMNNLKRHVLCLDRATGEVLWSKEYAAKLPESAYKSGNDGRHGYSTSTPTSDGESVYIFFGKSGVFAFDLDGNEKWTASVGDGMTGWGSATSPILYKDLLFINATVESESLIALNKNTGKEVWRAEGVTKAWCTPVLVDAGGKMELVMNLAEKVAAYDPETGEQLWTCQGVPDFYVCPSVIAKDGIVYATGGRKSETVAVRAGGRGDVTATHQLWRLKEGNNVTTPVLVEGYLYWFHESRGKVLCVEAATGTVAYEAELDPKPGLVYASPTAVDGKLIAPSQDNGTYVIAAKPQFELLAVNTFADDKARVNASVVVSNNQLLLRTDQAIYCIGQ